MTRQENIEKIREVFKMYWYYMGQWHGADCPFIRDDEGVCNCRTGLNSRRIKEELEKLI